MKIYLLLKITLSWVYSNMRKVFCSIWFSKFIKKQKVIEKVITSSPTSSPKQTTAGAFVFTHRLVSVGAIGQRVGHVVGVGELGRRGARSLGLVHVLVGRHVSGWLSSAQQWSPSRRRCCCCQLYSHGAQWTRHRSTFATETEETNTCVQRVRQS